MYEVFIARMVELNLIQPVIPYIRKILELDFPDKEFNTLYLVLLVLRISPELNDGTRNGLVGLIGHAFSQQEQIIKVIEFYINASMTSLDKGKTIAKDVANITNAKLNYSLTNGHLFKDAFLTEISTNNSQLQLNASLLVKCTWHHLRSTKP